jgi:hypothetical protein
VDITAIVNAMDIKDSKIFTDFNDILVIVNIKGITNFLAMAVFKGFMEFMFFTVKDFTEMKDIMGILVMVYFQNHQIKFCQL